MATDPQKPFDLNAGILACHRKQPMLMPGPLGHLQLANHPCLREKCALWDPKDNQCLDVTNADTLKLILRSLVALEDRLPPELP